MGKTPFTTSRLVQTTVAQKPEYLPTVRYFKFQDFNILFHTVPLLEDNQKSFAILEDMTEKQKGVSPGLLQLGHFLGMDCGTKLLTL